MLGKKDSLMELNRVGLSARNRHSQSYTTLRIFMPAHRLFTHASAPTHCKVRDTHTHTNMLPLNWSCHKEDTESWVARDKGRGERGLERGAAKMRETSILSVLAGLWATMSHQKSLSVPWHRLWICGAGGMFSHILPQEIPPFKVLLVVVVKNSLRLWHRI